MIVVVGPGQGAQTPGFLEPWLADPALRAQLESWSEVVGIDLVAHGTVSDADTIRDTAIAQPLIVAAGLLSLGALLEGNADREAAIGGYAGHSVGEITAAAASGVLSNEDALRFVAARGRAMADAAAAAEPTGMSAVLGGDEDALLARLEELGLSPANFNGGGQLVVAGDLDALAALAAEPVAGTRVIPLQVAGAFHTRTMDPARTLLADVAAELAPADPRATLWSNKGGALVTSGAAFVDLLVHQVAAPVRWDQVQTSMADAGITGMIELAPGGTLTGLARRSLKGVPTVALKTPDDLPAARALLDEIAGGAA